MKIKSIILISLLISSISLAADGVVQIKSQNSVKQTTKKLIKALKKKGMTIFKVINHKKGAKKVGKKLRPTTVVIFGNPKVGTPLMQCSQSIAIDLPQKALIYEDADGQVWFNYNDPNYLAKRHNVQNCGKILSKISHVLAHFAEIATNKD